MNREERKREKERGRQNMTLEWEFFNVQFAQS
jgi:hypothetical protein